MQKHWKHLALAKQQPPCSKSLARNKIPTQNKCISLIWNGFSQLYRFKTSNGCESWLRLNLSMNLWSVSMASSALSRLSAEVGQGAWDTQKCGTDLAGQHNPCQTDHLYTMNFDGLPVHIELYPNQAHLAAIPGFSCACALLP